MVIMIVLIRFHITEQSRWMVKSIQSTPTPIKQSTPIMIILCADDSIS